MAVIFGSPDRPSAIVAAYESARLNLGTFMFSVTVVDREHAFREEWDEMLALYGVLTRSEHPKLRDAARSKLALKLHQHGLKGVRDILRMPASDPAAIVEALRPTVLPDEGLPF